MRPIHRKTIASDVTITGTGLFTAQQSSLTIRPNHESTGIVFRADNGLIPANINHLSSTPPHPAFAKMPPRCTSICNEHTNIATVEHLLSALVGLGLTDVLVEIEGPEIPILDGSAFPFIEKLVQTRPITTDSTVEPIIVRSPIRIASGDASITIEPATAASYTYTLEYENDSPIQSATVNWSGDTREYIEQIANARTFCLKHEADAMHNAGLFTHLTPREMLVIGPDGPIDNALRHPNECALHKLLDLIGDLALVARPLIAKVTAIRSGHEMNHRAARKIVEQIAD